MTRSAKKGPYVDEKLYLKVQKAEGTGNRQPIKTWARAFMVHNGKVFQKVFVTEDMVGHKLGEFSPTRMFRSHTAGRSAGAQR